MRGAVDFPMTVFFPISKYQKQLDLVLHHLQYKVNLWKVLEKFRLQWCVYLRVGVFLEGVREGFEARKSVVLRRRCCKVVLLDEVVLLC